MTFDMVVIGSGGGNNETDLSAYLFKPSDADWQEGCIALEAGSGPGALSSILKQNPTLFGAKAFSASQIYSSVQCYLISHAHLDHIASLVVSAGSQPGPRKRIHASKQTLRDIETVFSDRLWPNLASWNEDDETQKLLYTILASNNKYHTIFANVSVKSFAVNHGQNESGVYESAAFFVRYDPTGKEFLFFGDVGPDSLASKPRTIAVWRAAAPKFPDILSTIFIECSWQSDRPDDLLYGHLNPQHLADELTALATEVVTFRRSISQGDSSDGPPVRKRQRKNPIASHELRMSLEGLRVFIIHCKDSMDRPSDARPIKELILEQVIDAIRPKELGVEILTADQGMLIKI